MSKKPKINLILKTASIALMITLGVILLGTDQAWAADEAQVTKYPFSVSYVEAGEKVNIYVKNISASTISNFWVGVDLFLDGVRVEQTKTGAAPGGGFDFSLQGNLLGANTTRLFQADYTFDASALGHTYAAGSYEWRMMAWEGEPGVGRKLMASVDTYSLTLRIDTTDPYFYIPPIDPADGSTVSGTTTWTVFIGDYETGIYSAIFYWDNESGVGDTSYPYTYTRDTSGDTNGDHTLYVEVYDNVTNMARLPASGTLTYNVQVDAPPALNRTGETNYTNDGLDPETGNLATSFTYRIKYSDPDNDAPSSIYLRVYDFSGEMTSIGSPFTMSGTDSTPDYVDGVIYVKTLAVGVLPEGGLYSYKFEASSGTFTAFSPEESGPIVADAPPALNWTGETNYTNDGLDPETGNLATSFTYRIKYSDPDNDAPSSIYLRVYDNSVEMTSIGSPFTMSGTEATPNYVDGVIYVKTLAAGVLPEGSFYTYKFEALSGTFTAFSPVASGPTVDNSAPVLAWSGNAGFTSDGVNPDSGNTTFDFEIKYSDVDNDAPSQVVGERPHLMIYKGGTAETDKIAEYRLTQVGSGTNWTGGEVFEKTGVILPGKGTDYYYAFMMHDGTKWTTYPATPTNGPTVTNSAPVLSWVDAGGSVTDPYYNDGVNPNSGDSTTEFTFKITYSDADGDAPSVWPKLYVYNNGVAISGSPFDMSGTDSTPDYVDGVIYVKTLDAGVLPEEGIYTYKFEATDGTATITYPATAQPGPTVSTNVDFIVFAPHPDDEALGCTRIIKQAVDVGSIVKIVVVSDGGASYIRKNTTRPLAGTPYRDLANPRFIRDDFYADWTYAEFVRAREGDTVYAMALLGLEESDITFLSYPDGKLSFADNREKVLADITAILADKKPASVYIPSSHDAHLDHIAVHQIVKEAVNASGITTVINAYPIYSILLDPVVDPLYSYDDNGAVRGISDTHVTYAVDKANVLDQYLAAHDAFPDTAMWQRFVDVDEIYWEEPVDSDFDGLFDEEEASLGTLTNDSDSDDDDLTDAAEIYRKRDTSTGLTIETNPLNNDTDSGGAYDGLEVKYPPKNEHNPFDDPTDDSPKPELRTLIQDITFDIPSPRAGETVTISATVHNVGEVDAGSFSVQFYDGPPDATNQIGTDQAISALTSGTSAAVSVSWDTAGLSGEYEIYVNIDAGNAISEHSEEDNITFKSIVVGGESSTIVYDFDSTAYNTRWESITWTGTEDGVVADIKVRIRTSNDNLNWSDWYGYYGEGTTISTFNIYPPDNRYLQAEAVLETTDITQMPVLDTLEAVYWLVLSASDIDGAFPDGWYRETPVSIPADLEDSLGILADGFYESEGRYFEVEGQQVINELLDANLMMYLFMDEGAGSTTADFTTKANDGTLSADYADMWTGEGRFGQALTFDGNDYVEVQDNDNLDFDPTDSFTISFWMKILDNSGGQWIIDKINTGVTYWQGYHVTLRADGTVYWMGHDTTRPDSQWPFVIISTTVVDDGKWHLITCVRDAEQDLVYIYVDGQSDATPVADISTLTHANNLSLQIGRKRNGTKYYAGSLDEVRIYSRALNAAEISAAYLEGPPTPPTGLTAMAGDSEITLDWTNNPEPDLAGYNVYRSQTQGGPYTQLNATLITTNTYTDTTTINYTTYYYVVTAVDYDSNESTYYSAEVSATPGPLAAALIASWPMDEGTGQTVYDQTTYGNNGTLSADYTDMWTEEGKFGSALSLDGENDYVKVPDPIDGSLDFDPQVDSFTLAAWVNVVGDNAAVKGQFIINKQSGGTTAPGYHMTLKKTTAASSPGTLGFMIHTSGSYTSIRGNTVVIGTGWHYVMAVYDASTDEVSLYVDGQSDATSVTYTPGEGDTAENNLPLYIGAYNSTTAFVNGTIDEVKLYDRALSADEISTEFSKGAPIPPTGLTTTAGDNQITLNWTNNPEPDLAGYNVYRSQTQGGPYTQLNATLITTNTYTDTTAAGYTTYYYVVTAVDYDSNESTYYSTEASAVPYKYQAGWPYSTGAEIYSSPALGDIDGDGDMEIVVGSYDNKVYALHHDGTLAWSYTTGASIDSFSPALGDIDGDGDIEIVVGSLDGKVYTLNNDGTLAWSYTTGGGVYSSSALGDIDGDGDIEIVVGSADNKVYALNNDGTLAWSYTTGDSVYSSPALGDIDGDGDIEIVVGSYDNKVYALNNDGTLAWSYTTGAEIDSSPALGDIDGDGDIEIVVGSLDGKVYAFHHNGDPVTNWPFSESPPAGPVWSSAALGDIDGDGDIEIVVGSGFGKVYALNHDGTLAWSYATGAEIYSSPALGDIDGDGDIEIVVGSFDGNIYTLHHNGTPVTGWPYATGAQIYYSSPALGDIDDDGDIDVVIGSGDGNIYAFDLSGTYDPANIEWGKFHYDIRNTGLYLEP